MKNLIRNSEKNCMSILFIVLIAMVFFVKDSNAYEGSVSAVHVKAAFEGLYDENQGALTKDVLVVVYLRNAEPPYEIVGNAKGYIDRNTMRGSFEFPDLRAGQYYIVLSTKNTIETWSRKGGELIGIGTKVTYDFTTGKEKAFGENMNYSKKHACVFTGDVNQDGFVDMYDVKAVYSDLGLKGDVASDLNGDLAVDKSDYEIVYTNYLRNVKAITPVNTLGLTVVELKVAFQGLYDDSNGYLAKESQVEVYLRNAEEPYEIVGSSKGTIDAKSLIGTFEFGDVPTGQYYIVLNSKNTIETWSRKGGELVVNGTKTIYDFTTGKEKAFGENMDFKGKHACIFTGDVNQDGFITKYDVRAVYSDIGVKGDLLTDLNGDDIVNKLDYDLVYTNFGMNVQSVKPINNLRPIAQENYSKENFSLKQNHPNPFNPSTQISFSVPMTSNVKLLVYDMSGREVAQLVNTILNEGSYTYKWNASDFASGTYFYRLNVNGLERTMKMHLIK